MDARPGPLTAVDLIRSPWLIGFGLVALAQLIFVVVPVPTPVDLIAVTILAPLLAVWVWRRNGPRLLVLALLLCAVGDLLGNPRRIGLDRDALLFSVAAFAAAQACLLVVYVRSGAVEALRASVRGRQRWRSVVALLYLIVAAVVFGLMWGGLAPTFRVAAGSYLALLVGTAITSLAVDTWAGIGAAVFAGSVLLVGAGTVGWVEGADSWHRLQVRLAYPLGLLLITVATVTRVRRGIP
ncbi:lysoplasmalogenase family protein [Microlunatus parietis]|uniref:YhhN-like protein n=1 Tax=Microlunatus parietis TaxID=682979 RepID=A0A7Y9L9S9_9ACTN|nr:lysoplasmalogenase family protein [Microlunatus parietis]NYE69118.1 hypothetical protein [Microlunatus parietis]